ASSMSYAMDRGLQPVADRLRALAPAPTSRMSSFRRDRDVWTLTFAEVTVQMPDAKGLRDLRTLLANPGVEVPVASLVTDEPVSAGSSAVLDARAKAEYRRRLDELDGQLDRAAWRGDAAGAELLERERQVLLDELRRAAGLGGRDRTINDERERLR